MAKIIKEIIIMLLICLAGMLIFALTLYKYIPNRKVVSEVKEYVESAEIKELKADNIDQSNSEIVTSYKSESYKVTSSDLKNYENSDDYVPGKSNPFGPAIETTNNPTGNSTSTKKSQSTNSSTTSSSSSQENNTSSTINEEENSSIK